MPSWFICEHFSTGKSIKVRTTASAVIKINSTMICIPRGIVQQHDIVTGTVFLLLQARANAPAGERSNANTITPTPTIMAPPVV